MQSFFAAIFTLLVAGAPGVTNALAVPSERALITEVRPFTGLPDESSRSQGTADIYTLPKSHILYLRSLHDTSIGLRESSLAIRNPALALRDSSLDPRDSPAASAVSTITTTVTAPVITTTMAALDSTFIPVDGTTYHFSTTIPWGPGPSDRYPTGSAYSEPTIMSNGTPAATLTSFESTLNTMPPPSITSGRSFTTTSNASTTIITPASELSTLTSLSASDSTPTQSATSATAITPTITYYSLTTVNPPSESSEAPSAPVSTTGFVQNAGQDVKCGYYKIGIALIAGLLVNVVLAAFL